MEPSAQYWFSPERLNDFTVAYLEIHWVLRDEVVIWEEAEETRSDA